MSPHDLIRGKRNRLLQPTGRFDLNSNEQVQNGFCPNGSRSRKWVAGALGALALSLSFIHGASAETRSLKLYYLHTGEKAEIVFKRDGRYDQAGLKKINNILRDWRRNEPTKMDPRLMDLVWEAYRQSGATGYINVVCGYRSPSTNSMLRSRSKGVAKKSQHMLGKAMDFYIPGVKLKTLREIGLKMQGGGVGYYPTSGSPFVHFDVGNVRHWPKMSRRELVALFPNGKTLHVPSDGKPLPGFEQALASYKSRQSAGALAIASATGGGAKKGKGLLAALFGGGEDDEEEISGASGEEMPVAKPSAKARKAQAELVKSVEKTKQPGIQVIAPEDATPAEMPREEEAPVADQPAAETPETVIASLNPRKVPLPFAAPRPEDVPKLADAVTDVIADAAAEQPAVLSEQAPVELASSAPLPSWRPAGMMVGEEAAAPEASVLTALAESEGTREKAASLISTLPSNRPEAAEVLASAMLPDQAIVPGFAPAKDDASVELASLSSEDALPANTESPAAIERALVSKSASPRAAFAAAARNGEKVASFSDVKTTGKSGRPSRRDLKPDARPVVLAAAPDAARWALRGEAVTTRTAGTKAPSFAYNIVRTAPREVYTAGFGANTQVASANRFSGKAVTFLSVARFQTN